MSAKLLADIVAVVHGLLVVYVAGGAVLTVIGVWRRWEFVRNFAFRYSHLLLCLSVNVFEWANLPCPLTSIEQCLRKGNDAPGKPPGFIQEYVSRSIHFHVEPAMLARLTLPLLLLMTALFVWAGPRRRPEDDLPEQARVAPKPRAPVWRIVLTLACLFALATRIDIPLEWLSELIYDPFGSWSYDVAFLFFAAALCLFSPKRCGLGLGSARRWRRHALPIALVLAIPPLAVATVYANYTSKPFHDFPMRNWLLTSIAQEFLFCGFVYARLCELWGTPGENIRDAFAWPMLVTPLIFISWHWPVVHWIRGPYLALMCVYLMLGGWWMLNIRRWTGSLWPGVVLHVVVNYLAAKV